MVLTVNLDRGDLAFRTAFPIIITNALGWFAGQAGELRESLAAGSITEVQLPAGAESESIVLQAPGGQTRPLPRGLVRVTVGPLDACGICAALAGAAADTTSEQAPLAELACNLASSAESDVRARVAPRAAGGGGAGRWVVHAADLVLSDRSGLGLGWLGMVLVPAALD